METGTTVSAGNRRKVQVRKERKDAFSATKKQVFLDHYAAGCNVTRAAAAAGVSTVTVNNHRRNDPVFAQQMAEAHDIAYDGLDAMLVERAKTGGHYVPGPDAETAPGPEAMDTELALRLLELRSRSLGRRTGRRIGRAGYEPRRVSEKELNEAILAKLDVLDRRMKLKRAEVRKLKTREAVNAVLRDAGSTGSPAPQDERAG
jgi:phage terminase small subunit